MPGGERARLAELARVFLRLGATAFGGPAAHVALMEDELVARRRWLERAEFLDLVGATNLIPGPNSTELAIHIGRLRAGWAGLLVAGAAFILPAALLVTALAWGYVRWGRLPVTEAVLYGVKPAVVAVVAQALWRLGRTALATRPALLVAAAAAAALVAGVGEIAVLAAAAVGGAALRPGTRRGAMTVLAPLAVGGTAASAAPAVAPTAWPIFAFFCKVGSVLFGSGYVLLAFLRGGLVADRHWLTEGQLLDAVAVGQLTPGPLFTTATFVGYLLAGGAGAAAATVGIFLPAFVFVAASGPLIPRIRRSPTAGAALDAVNAASLALMGVVTAQLARAALVDATTVVLAAACALLLLRWRVNSVWLILGAGLVGLAARGLCGTCVA